jgi:quercetin dioxygenase-like cupin family protein
MAEAMNPLITAIANLYRSSAHDMLHRAAIELDTLKDAIPAPTTPKTLPVCQHLDAALAAAEAAPLHSIATAIAPLAHTSVWTQNPNYVAQPPSPSFLKNYGYVEWVGPGRAIHSATIRVGILMLGPATEYPEHHHPTEEVYHVISGHALWSKSSEPWHQHPPGAAIHHAPHVPHATKTLAEPLLALYCWSGDIHAAARLTSSP